MTLNRIADLAHATAKEKGWTDDVPVLADIALMHSELSEAVEVFRDPGRTISEVWMDDNGKPEGLAVELADCIIRICHFAAKHNLDMESALKMKMEYNATRPFRHGNRRA